MQPDYEPIKQVKVSTLIVDQIKSHIVGGNLKPGDVLPSERDLMKSFNVSRSSLREALKILDATGFIEIAQRKRTRVKSIVPDSFIEPIRPLLKENLETVLEVHDVRRCLESWNAYYAAERATEEDIEGLRRNIESMEKKIKDNQSLVDEDADFHLAISSASHNKIQTHLMYSIYALIRDTVGICYETDESRDILEEHQNIFKAIKDKNSELARRMMNAHLDKVQARVHRFFNDRKILHPR
ncbi:FadR/GntR family transcriptional regulator [Desulfospira joergensenii]|uniref:FadR/GntR family transcriptional regulator n=1 Tax=Desulfospira joergensenii TaxID=53329 RepID=UPI00137787CD|nr:FadR/GntR family transcriptional regulator [Desulfospira joergensenii]